MLKTINSDIEIISFESENNYSLPPSLQMIYYVIKKRGHGSQWFHF
jgi:hypothetical protein